LKWKNPPPWNGNERLSISSWHVSASDRTGPSGERFPRPFVFSGDLVVGPVVVETQEKITIEKRKFSENHAQQMSERRLRPYWSARRPRIGPNIKELIKLAMYKQHFVLVKIHNLDTNESNIDLTHLRERTWDKNKSEKETAE
jgi:hypothetical protein